MTKYVVTYYATDTPVPAFQTKETTTTSVTIDGLSPTTDYTFKIKAYNGNTAGPFSSAFKWKTSQGKN